MCLDTHAQFRGDRPLRAEISKSPVKIGLKLTSEVDDMSLAGKIVYNCSLKIDIFDNIT